MTEMIGRRNIKVGTLISPRPHRDDYISTAGKDGVARQKVSFNAGVHIAALCPVT